MTAQTMDPVLHAGRRFGARVLPLDPWLRAHPDVLEAFSSRLSGSSLWRGYIASWAVNDGKLWLADIRSDAITFPDALHAGLPLLAGWVTGGLPLLYNNASQAAEDRDPSDDSTVVLLTIEGGAVVREQRFVAEVNARASGLHIYGVPRFRGLSDDDSFWGLDTIEQPWPGASPDTVPSGWHPREALFDDSSIVGASVRSYRRLASRLRVAHKVPSRFTARVGRSRSIIGYNNRLMHLEQTDGKR